MLLSNSYPSDEEDKENNNLICPEYGCKELSVNLECKDVEEIWLNENNCDYPNCKCKNHKKKSYVGITVNHDYH